eukprot:COSAG06_NODE_36979_length_440_cov_13.489736_1_plen_51_part_10
MRVHGVRARGAGRRPSVPGLARENRKRGSLPSRPVRGFNTAEMLRLSLLLL